MPGIFPGQAMPNGMRPPGQFTPQMAHMSPGMMSQHPGQMQVMPSMPQQMTQQVRRRFFSLLYMLS